MSRSDTPTQLRVRGNGIDLNVLELGQSGDPAIIMLHGLRDTAWALLPIAGQLLASGDDAKGFRVLIPDLRGHGDSERSDAYAMPDFLLDLLHVVRATTNGECALFGHSLGGHVVTRFAGLFPEMVKALMVVEGLGPPKRPHEGDQAMEVQAYREMLLSRVAARPSTAKSIANIADVVTRLLRNNPRLDPAEAERIAPHMVESVDGDLRWAFDSRANSVFVGISHLDNTRFWHQVQAPTCIVSGALSYQYWGGEMKSTALTEYTGHFAEGEMEQRAENFTNHQHHWFEHSGHMVHYDEPERLGAMTRNFMEQNYV